MGFFASLLGWKKLLDYQIVFDKPKIEMYYTKEPAVALEFLRAAANNPQLQLEPGQAEAIRSQGLRLFPGGGTQVAVTVSPVTEAILRMEYIRLWAFYQAKVIFNLGHEQVSGIVLMQYTVLTNRDDANALQVLTKTARNLVELCTSARYQLTPALAVRIPNEAYLKAGGLPV